MAPPPPLSVATNSINRLLKEESSYRTELATQQQRVEKLQADGGGGGEDEEDGGNREFRLRQEVGLCVSFLSFFLSFLCEMLVRVFLRGEGWDLCFFGGGKRFFWQRVLLLSC